MGTVMGTITFSVIISTAAKRKKRRSYTYVLTHNYFLDWTVVRSEKDITTYLLLKKIIKKKLWPFFIKKLFDSE